MKALVYAAPGAMEWTSRPTPQPGPGEVTVTVRAVGICGSDVHGYAGESGRRPTGIIMGHEATGEVAALGAEAPQALLGQQVVIYPILSCNAKTEQCEECHAGYRNRCLRRRMLGGNLDGAMAEALVVPVANLFPAPRPGDFIHGTLVEPLASISQFAPLDKRPRLCYPKSGHGVQIMDNTHSRQQPSLVRTVSKAVDVLECLGAERTALSAAQVAECCGLARPTAYRLLGTLAERGYVRQDPASGKFLLGYKVLDLSGKLVDGIELRKRAAPFLQKLGQLSGETVHMAVLEGSDVVYIDKVESTSAVRLHSTIGSRYPAYCTSLGKAILAYLPDEERAQVLKGQSFAKRTERTITDPVEFEAHLQQVRQQGFAIDDEENSEGIRCVGAPIFDFSKKVVAAISVTGLAYRLDVDSALLLADEVKACAVAISDDLGH